MESNVINTNNRVLVNKNKMASFICPKCGLHKIVNVASYMKKKSIVNVKCKCQCGYTNVTLLERRNNFRNEVNLTGIYNSYKRGHMGYCTIKDLSRSGLKIELSEKNENIKTGDKLYVTFELDNNDRSRIRKDVIVRNKNGKLVGAEFCSKNHYDILGPYLLYSCG